MGLGELLRAAFPSTRLRVGDAAPPFEALADDGRTVRLSDFSGRALVLFFYLRDATPG